MHLVQTMLGRVAEHVSLQAMLVAEECQRNALVEAPRCDQRDCLLLVSNVFAVSNASVRALVFLEPTLEVLHAETAGPRLMVADHHDLQLGLLARRELAEKRLHRLVQAGDLLASGKL